MGLELDEGSLGGILRVTASTPEKARPRHQRISFVGGGAKDIYASNIQVADLNALNAVLAVVSGRRSAASTGIWNASTTAPIPPTATC